MIVKQMSRQDGAFDIMADVKKLMGMLACCAMCPRKCGVNRTAGEVGYCGIGGDVRIASAGAHFGEESVLVGRAGSGTIFFAGCNLRCIFCQNYDISHQRHGRDISIDQLADIMLSLQHDGVSNINFVTPSHVAAWIAGAIEIAREKGLRLPTVYNTGGYDSVETLKALQGLIDIYMPDMKYADPEISAELSDAADYPEINRAAVKEMHRQVGDLDVQNGLARRGLLVRHLVLPNHLAGSFETLDFLAAEISAHTTVNVMGQYRPCRRADEYPAVNRYPTAGEIAEAIRYAKKKGLNVLEK
jgi:putative pyruvate formate lyase activating enzyme